MAFYKFILVLFICGFAQLSFGQDRYAVHYKYKPQTLFSLNDPSAFLSDAAIERRDRHRVSLDSLDLPVATKYIEALDSIVHSFLYHSNWLNASLIVATAEQVSSLSQFEFIEKIVFVAPNFYPQSRIDPQLIPEKFGKIEALEDQRIENQPAFAFQNEVLGIPEMHELGFKGKGVTVAVFDAGFPSVNTIPSLSHIISNGQLIGTKDFVQPWITNVFDKHQHGSNVLSLIASNDPDLLLAGAPEANYILCITEDVFSEFRIEEYNWVKAAEYADSLGVDIINSSLGYWDFDDPSMDYSIEDLNGATSVITKGATIAAEKGILVVTSAGNYGSRGPSSITMPADANGILAIGSVNQDLTRSNFSSQGPTSDGRIKPDLTTFGNQVFVMRPNGIVNRGSGTSFSAPQITALAAGLWQAQPDWTKDELIEYLIKSATQADNPDNNLGHGIPDFRKAFLGEVLSVESRVLSRKIFPNPITGDVLFIEFDDFLQAQFTLIDPQGRMVSSTVLTRDDQKRPFTVQIPGHLKGFFIVQLLAGREVYRTKLIKK